MIKTKKKPPRLWINDQPIETPWDYFDEDFIYKAMLKFYAEIMGTDVACWEFYESFDNFINILEEELNTSDPNQVIAFQKLMYEILAILYAGIENKEKMEEYKEKSNALDSQIFPDRGDFEISLMQDSFDNTLKEAWGAFKEFLKKNPN